MFDNVWCVIYLFFYAQFAFIYTTQSANQNMHKTSAGWIL